MEDLYPTRKLGTEKILPRHWLPPVDDYSRYSLDYAKNGFVVIPGFFHGAERQLSGMREFARRNFDAPEFYSSPEPETGRVRSILGFHRDDCVAKFMSDTSLFELAEGFIGEGCYIHQSRINYKRGMESNGWKWHSDFETWHYQDGMPEPKCLSVMIPLVENTLANGPLMVLAGSHKEFVSCPAPAKAASAEENFSDQKEGIPSADAITYFLDRGGKIEVVQCAPGDVVIFDCNLLHVSSPNVTPYGRENMFFVFNAKSNALVAPFSGDQPRPNEMGERQ